MGYRASTFCFKLSVFRICRDVFRLGAPRSKSRYVFTAMVLEALAYDTAVHPLSRPARWNLHAPHPKSHPEPRVPYMIPPRVAPPRTRWTPKTLNSKRLHSRAALRIVAYAVGKSKENPSEQPRRKPYGAEVAVQPWRKRTSHAFLATCSRLARTDWYLRNSLLWPCSLHIIAKIGHSNCFLPADARQVLFLASMSCSTASKH